MLSALDPPSDPNDTRPKCQQCPRRGATVRLRSVDNFGGNQFTQEGSYVFEWVTLCDACAMLLENVI
jgi:hypothetical protein